VLPRPVNDHNQQSESINPPQKAVCGTRERWSRREDAQPLPSPRAGVLRGCWGGLPGLVGDGWDVSGVRVVPPTCQLLRLGRFWGIWDLGER